MKTHRLKPFDRFIDVDIKQILIAAVAIGSFICFTTAPVAFAMPLLDFQFVNSGQTFGATDVVPVYGKITNVGPDALTNAFGSGSFGPVPTQIHNQYIDSYPPGISVTPPGLVSLNPGQSIEWLIVHWSPWPITGNPGDPVAPGTYDFPIADYSASLSTFDTFPYPPYVSLNDYNVNTSGASDFTWTVAATPVLRPEPGTLMLFVIGLGLLSVSAASRHLRGKFHRTMRTLRVRYV